MNQDKVAVGVGVSLNLWGCPLPSVSWIAVGMVSLLFICGCPLPFFRMWVLLESIYDIIAMDRDKGLLPQGMVLLCILFFYCHPPSVDILVGKCSFSPLIRWPRIRTRNCCWNGCVSDSLEVVHCHPSSVDILECKCSFNPLIRWLRNRTRSWLWNGFGSYSL